MIQVRRPTTIEEALTDTIESIAHPDEIQVVLTTPVMVEILQLLIKLKHL